MLTALSLVLVLLAPPLDLPTVQRHVDRASAFVEAGDWPRACLELEIVAPFFADNGDDPRYRWNVARCREETGKPEKAVAEFEKVLTLTKDAKVQANARDHLENLRAHRLGVLVVDCNVPAAQVRFAETSEAEGFRACPAEWRDLALGHRALVGQSVRGVEVHETATVRAGQTTTVSLVFPALLSVRSPVPAVVLVDDRRAGSVRPDEPLALDHLPPGIHRVQVSPTTGAAPWEREIVLDAGAHLVVDAQLTADAPVVVGPSDPFLAMPALADPPPAVQSERDLTWLWVSLGAAAAITAGLVTWQVLDDDGGSSAGRPRIDVQ
ncbi:MAG: hypothetical protein KC620_02265 [Myxococcales bacterium]|nr:hypothetical protein [Myxococcales bacterium]